LPISISFSARWDPINPAPPVISVRIAPSLASLNKIAAQFYTPRLTPLINTTSDVVAFYKIIERSEMILSM
jgi:hypothetical protein